MNKAAIYRHLNVCFDYVKKKKGTLRKDIQKIHVRNEA